MRNSCVSSRSRLSGETDQSFDLPLFVGTLVRFDCNSYSVPTAYAHRRQVTIVGGTDEVRLVRSGCFPALPYPPLGPNYCRSDRQRIQRREEELNKLDLQERIL